MKGVIRILNAVKSEITTNIWFYKIVFLYQRSNSPGKEENVYSLPIQ